MRSATCAVFNEGGGWRRANEFTIFPDSTRTLQQKSDHTKPQPCLLTVTQVGRLLLSGRVALGRPSANVEMRRRACSILLLWAKVCSCWQQHLRQNQRGLNSTPRQNVILLSTSKPKPDDSGVANSLPTATPQMENSDSTNDDFEDIRERIRRRAQELNLEASDAPAVEVYDSQGPKSMMQQVIDDAMEQAETEELAAQYGDGLSLIDGARKELSMIEWPSFEENAQNLGIVIGLTAFMVAYIYFLDTTFQKLLQPLYNF